MIIIPPGTIELCELCGEPMDADNCYGTDDMPLCREHQEKFNALLHFLSTGQLPLPEIDYG
jgi:hypothetical protein